MKCINLQDLRPACYSTIDNMLNEVSILNPLKYEKTLKS